VLCKVLFISSQHAIEPGQKLLGAVVRVHDNGDAIGGSNVTDVMGTSNGSEDGSSLVLVGDSLACKEGSATVRELDNDGRLDITSSLYNTMERKTRNNVSASVGRERSSKLGRGVGLSSVHPQADGQGEEDTE